MKSISLTELEHVTGGTTGADTSHIKPVTGSTSSGLSNDQLLTSLNSIGSSIKNLNSNNNSLFGSNGGALMLGMALAMRNRQQTSVYVGRHGYYWQSSW